MKTLILAVNVCLVAALSAGAALYSWQEPHAKVLPTGDLEWAPKAFVFEKGESVRYIDYEGGKDSNDGLTRDTAWKHHPLDKAAIGSAKAGAGTHTYIFRRGAVYRGALQGVLEGTEDNPVRLTSDPSWGEGEAVISGAERVARWKLGASRGDMSEADKVWRTELPFAPRSVWMVDDGKVTRIALARTPNWTVSDPQDTMSEWWEWEQPEWWKDKNKTEVEGKKMHLGIDRKHLTGNANDYVGGIVWSEWGIVMGTPFSSRIESFDTGKRGIGFQGFWYNDSGKIITGNRYFLEDKPNFLDGPGEFWFENRGGGGTLYIRLPEDADPNMVQVEAAKRINLVDCDSMRHVRVNGLTFRFSNAYSDPTARGFSHRDVESAAVRLLGSGEDVQIRNCRFEYVTKAMRLKAIGDDDSLDGVVLADNDIRFTDHGAIEIDDSSRWAKKEPPFGELGDVKVLRNRLFMIGLRPYRSSSAHALVVNFAETLEVAGNMLDRCYGSGIFLFIGKGSGQLRDRPLSRALVHHNKVTQPLLQANDWGGIETWQGGPTYVYNNISGDPNGTWNWSYSPGKPNSGRLGYAYYLDGGYKNYHFNNIAWGNSNDLTSKLCNNTAFYHATPTMLNTFFNNTAYNFADGSGWSPAGGRQLYLGNLWMSISRLVFHHSKQKEDKDAVYAHYPHHTMAYSRNVFHDVPNTIGIMEGSGTAETDLAGFRKAAEGRHLLASDIGEISADPVVRDAAGHDFRPVAGGAASGKGANVFVPWALSRMVGEWNFRRNNANPEIVLDDHWYMSQQVGERGTYRNLPRYDLKGVNVTADDYVDGPLEDWTAGALKLNGRDQYLSLASIETAVTEETDAGPTKVEKPADWLEVEVPASVVPDEPFKIKVSLSDALQGQKIVAHLHWLKKEGWGGFMALGQPMVQGVKGEGSYTFTFKPEDKNDLDSYSLLVALTPTGEWKDQTVSANMKLAKSKPVAPVPVGMPNPHDVNGNFLVEAYFKTEPGAVNGALVSDMDERGYELFVDGGGAVTFLVQADNEVHVGTNVGVNDGKWHHVIAEADRTGGALRIYLDGKLAAERKASPQGSCVNDADLLVGKSGRGNFLAGSIEFLRVSLGTLADAKTTIEELYAWQFDGPFLRDFTGMLPKDGKRDAGALEAQ